MRIAELAPGLDVAFQLPLRRDGAVNMGAFTLPRLQPGRAVDGTKPYQKGDPVRFIDWRSYARTDKLYLREKLENTRVGIEIAIDGGASMAFPDGSLPHRAMAGTASAQASPPVTKLETALRLSYFLGYELASLGEQVTLGFFRGGQQDQPDSSAGLVYQSSDRMLLRSHFEQLSAAPSTQNPLADGAEIAAAALEPNYLPPPRSRQLRLVVSDALTTDVETWLTRFSSSSGGVFIHTLSHLELDLSWMASDDVYFDHSGQRLRTTGKSFEKYQQQVSDQRQAWLEGCEAACHRQGWTYLQAVDTDPADHFLACLAALLAARR